MTGRVKSVSIYSKTMSELLPEINNCSITEDAPTTSTSTEDTQEEEKGQAEMCSATSTHRTKPRVASEKRMFTEEEEEQARLEILDSLTEEEKIWMIDEGQPVRHYRAEKVCCSYLFIICVMICRTKLIFIFLIYPHHFIILIFF